VSEEFFSPTRTGDEMHTDAGVREAPLATEAISLEPDGQPRAAETGEAGSSTVNAATRRATRVASNVDAWKRLVIIVVSPFMVGGESVYSRGIEYQNC
jgi:hypothetical protein